MPSASRSNSVDVVGGVRRCPDAPTTAAVVLAVVVGAGIRWVLGELFPAEDDTFDVGLLVANVVGTALVGAVSGSNVVDQRVRTALVVGAGGGITTFSGLTAAIAEALDDSRPGLAIATLTAHLAVGTIAFVAGRWGAATVGSRRPSGRST